MKNLFITTLILAANGLSIAKSPISYTLYQGNFNGIYYTDNDQDDYYTTQSLSYLDNDNNFGITGIQKAKKEYGNLQNKSFYTGIQFTIYDLSFANYNFYISSINSQYDPLYTSNSPYDYSFKSGFFYDNLTIEEIYNHTNNGSNYYDYTEISNLLDGANCHLKQYDSGRTQGQYVMNNTYDYMSYTEQERQLNQYRYYIEYWNMPNGTTTTEDLLTTLIVSTTQQQWVGSHELIAGNSGTTIINLPDMLFRIFMMPWQFMSIAFNLTIFPGTPYQINFASLILGLFGAILAIVIIKIVLKVIK